MMSGIETFGPAAAWLWIAISAGLATAEVLVGPRALIWAAAAALLTAAAVALAPQIAPAAQAGVFAVLAVALVALGSAATGERGAAAVSAALVGREAEVIAFTFHEGQVAIDGVAWPARLDGASSRTPGVGERMRVTAADGKVVWVRPL